MADPKSLTPIANAEHISTDNGENINAKRVGAYNWDGANWNRATGGSLLRLPYDSQYFSNPDANGNYQTITSKLNGASQEVLTLTYDGSNNVTSIVRS